MATRQTQQNNQQQQIRSSVPPDHRGLLLAALVMMLIGWGGLARLIMTSLPRIGGELWLFFALLQIAITGTVIPIVRYLNTRFTALDKEPPPGGVIVRQSVWIGLFCVSCAWLQIPRALTVTLAIFIALVFIIVELLLRLREIASERY